VVLDSPDVPQGVVFCKQGNDIRSTVCAIKELKNTRGRNIDEFVHEVDVLKKLTGKHQNIVRMLVRGRHWRCFANARLNTLLLAWSF
jgi:hypothetical protein